jgi:hypothetical protein
VQEGRPFQIRLAVRPARTAVEPPPESLLDRNWYTGAEEWLMIQLGPWGHAHVDLARGEATAVLAPELAARPDIVSHSLLNTILLNFCLHHGYGMLHASCLVRDGRALLLMAPHDSGKSTTALQLVLNGYRLLTDSMVHISPYGAGALLCGFPVGTIKLREDVLSQFPEVHAHLRRERVRDETKFSLDLRRYDPRLVADQAWPAGVTELCLLRRHDAPHTELAPAGDNEVWQAVLRNSLFYDEPVVWERNLARIAPLLSRARAHHMTIGHNADEIVTAVNRLWAS